MKLPSFSLLPAGGPPNALFFERSRRTRGWSGKSYSEQVHTPDSVRAERQKTVAVLLLCLFLPPVGVFCLWRGGIFSLISRIAATLLAAFSMTVIFYLFIVPKGELTASAPPDVSSPTAVTEYSSSSVTVSGDGADAANPSTPFGF